MVLVAPMEKFPHHRLLLLDFSIRFVGIACYTIFIAGVYSLSGSAFHVGLLGAIIVLPALAVSLGIGKIVALFSARPILNFILLCRLILFAAIALSSPTLVPLLLAAAANSLLHQTSVVVKMSLDATLISEPTRNRFLSSKGMQSSVILTIAPAVGGLLFGLWGLSGALAMMAGLLCVALVVVNLLRMPRLDSSEKTSNPQSRPSAMSSWSALRAVPALHAAVMLYCLVAIILETEAPLTFPFVDEKLNQDAAFAGILLGVGGLGGILGAASTRFFPKILIPATIKWLILADGIFFLLFTMTSNLAASVVLFVALGAMGAITLVIVEGAVQRDVESANRPFVFSLMQFSAGAGGATVGILAAFIASQIGTPIVLAACALLEILAATWLIARAGFSSRQNRAQPDLEGNRKL